MIRVQIGEATVELRGEQHTIGTDAGGHLRTSATYTFDDVLHAVQRLGSAVLFEADVPIMHDRLSQLRRELSNRSADRRGVNAKEAGDVR